LNVYRTRRTFVPFAAVAASTALVACHRSDSILLVEVAGDLTLHPATFAVMVTAGGDTRSLQIRSTAGAAIDLPASFSLELNPSLTGPISISIEAQDTAGFVIARGSTTQEDIDVGGQTIIAVSLVATSGGGADAGDAGDADDGSDAAGGGATGGAGGSGGVGGRGGVGGGMGGGVGGRGGVGGGGVGGHGGVGGGAGS
jgi:hypothetical protein